MSATGKIFDSLAQRTRDVSDNLRGAGLIAKFGLDGDTLAIYDSAVQDRANMFTNDGKAYNGLLVMFTAPKAGAYVKVIPANGQAYYIPIVAAGAVVVPTPTVTPTPTPAPVPPVVPVSPTPVSNLLPDDPAAGFGIIPFATFAGAYKLALAWYTALAIINTGVDDVALTPIRAKDVKDGQDYENIDVIGGTLDISGFTNFKAKNVRQLQGADYGIKSLGCLPMAGATYDTATGKGVWIDRLTISGVGSAGIYGGGRFTRADIGRSAGDILKATTNFVGDLIYGHEGGWNSPSAHADFDQTVGGGGPVTLTRCFALMSRAVPNTKSNSFFQGTGKVNGLSAMNVVIDGFGYDFHLDAINAAIDMVYTFGTEQFGLQDANVSATNRLGRVFNAVTGAAQTWKQK